LLLDYFDGREPESKLARDMQKKVFEARGNDQWRREYMSYQMELNQQYKNGRAEGIEQGMKQGIEQGKKQGVQQATEDINKLIKVLLSQKKYDELEKMSEDKEYQNELMKKYNIIE
jgi:flagellar biosynthesis/type III secretory pathway protein FliH